MDFDISLSSGIPFWLGAVIALGAVGLSTWAYSRGRRGAPRGYLATLAGIRVLAIAILSLLVFRPLVTSRTQEPQQERIAILADTSKSMAVRDYPNLPDRLSSVKSVLATDGAAMTALKKKFRVSVFAFDKNLGTEVTLAGVPTLKAEGAETRVSEALAAIAAGFQQGKPARIILFSDGVDTSRKETEYEGAVPVTAVGVGSRLSVEGSFRDVILSSVEVLPEGQPVISKGAVAQIAAHVEGLGYVGYVVPVRLEDAEGRVLAEETVTIDGQRGDQKVILSYAPAEKGNYRVHVDIPVQADETIRENNSRTLGLTVTDPTITVLYAEGTLRWEYRYLKRTLERDPNVRVAALVRLSERTFYQQGNVTDIQMTGFPQDLETLKKFNVIMIGDLPASALSQQDMTNLRQVVADGAGFAMLGGYNSFADGGYSGTSVADLLAVDLSAGAGGQDKNEFVPGLTDLGEVSAIFAGITDYFDTPSRKAAVSLPGLLGQTRTGRAKPAASVLAVNPLRSDANGQLPVLVAQTYGSGRSIAFAADTTWRWYVPLVGLGRQSPYVRFWGQMIRWLAGRESREETGQPGVTAFLDKAFYAPGDRITVSAEVRGFEGLLTEKAVVEATVSGQTTLPVQLPRVTGSRGTYSATLDAPSPGTYKTLVSAVEGDLPLGEARLSFEVQSEDVEMRRIDMDEDNLRRIASESGGAYVPLMEFASYAASLGDEGETERVIEVFSLRQKRVLYPLFVFFVALVSVEWAWRKRIEMP